MLSTRDASMVEIAAIHLEGDAIQWFDWFNILMESSHGDNSKKDY